MIPGMYAYRTITALLLCLFQQEENLFDHYLYLLTFNGLICIFIILGMVVNMLKKTYRKRSAQEFIRLLSESNAIRQRIHEWL